MTAIDLSFLNGGKDLAFSLAQLKAMDEELNDIAAKSPEILALANSFGLTYANAQKLTRELQLAPQALSSAVSIMGQLKTVGADAVTQYAVLGKQLGLSAEQMRLLTETVDELGGKKDVVNDLSQALGQLFVLDKVNQFKAAIFSAGKEFEQLNTRLKTTLGTQAAADAAFANIEKFASTTPFQLTEVTDAYVKLKQRGIDPTNKALTNLGDLASSQGKSLNQTTEALLDASQGEFERLKEFGIKASAAGDKVNLSFQGVNKQVERTPEAISAGVLALGQLEGVAGGMAEQSKTLTGAMSNLEDSTGKLAKEAFEIIAPVAIELTKAATSLINTFFELPEPLQKTILVLGLLGGAFASAVVAMAAFKAAGIATALANGAQAVLAGPAVIAAGAQTIATKAAALAQLELNKAKVAGAASTGASTAATTAEVGALAAETAALGANTAAQTANNAAKAGAAGAGAKAAAGTAASTAAAGAGTAASAGGAAAAGGGAAAAGGGSTAVSAGAGSIAGVALAVTAALAVSAGLVAETFLNVTQQEREAVKLADELAKNQTAVAEATKKRETSASAAKAAEEAAATKARRAKLGEKELAADLAKDNAKYEADYVKDLEARRSWLQLVLDKIREFINIPASLLTKTFELVAKLPAPKVLKDFFANAAKQAEQFKLRLSTEALRDDDTLAKTKVNQEANKLIDQKKATANKAGGLQNLSKAELEPQIKSFEAIIERLEKTKPANSQQAQEIQYKVEELQAQKAELEQANKLVQEREKRVASAGTAEQQFAAEVRKTSENIGKQIATSEDANKQIELTKKQLEGGFIDSATAQKQFEQVAAYTSATGDVQVAAANELRAIREKDFDFRAAELESEAQLAELAGAQEIKTAEQVAAEVAKVKAKQADLEVERIKATLNEEEAAGRSKGEVYKRASQELQSALRSQQQAQAEATAATRREQVSSINKAIQDAQQIAADSETKGATQSKQATLAAIQSGNQSIEDAEKEADKKRLEARRLALAEEIRLKQSKAAELASIGSKEAKEEAKRLGSEVLKLQEQQVDLEIEAVKKAQKEKLDEIKESQEKRKTEIAKDGAGAELAIASQELAAVRSGELSKAEIKEQAAEAGLKAQQETLAKEQELIQQQLASIRKSQQEGLLSKKDADKQTVQLETELASKRTAVVRAQIQQQEQLEAKRLRVLQEAIAKRRALADREAADQEASSSASNLADVKAGVLSREDLEAKSAQRREAIAKKQAEVQVSLTRQELADTQRAIAEGLLNRKDGADKVLQLQTQLSKALASQADQEAEAIQSARARAQKQVEDSLRRSSEAAAAANAKASAEAEIEIAKAKLAAAGATGEKLEQLEKQSALKRQELAVASAKASAESAQREADSIDKLVKAGAISKQDSETRKTKAVADATKAQADLISAQADFESLKITQVRDAQLKAISEASKAKQLAADRSISAIQTEQALIAQASELASAEQGLFSARKSARDLSTSLATQELDIQRQMAEATGDTAKAEEFASQIKKLELEATKAQRAEIEAQFEAKRQSLELDIQSKQLAAEQLVIEKELAVLEAQSAVQAAVLEGKSKSEVDLLRQKAEASAKALSIADRALDNQSRVAGLQRQTLDLERSVALNSNASEVRGKAAAIDVEAAKVGRFSNELGSARKPDQQAPAVQQNASQLSSLIQPVEGVSTAASAMTTALSSTTDELTKLAQAAASLSSAQRQPVVKLAGARELGGSVLAGKSYLVGEKGPEIATFGQNGRVFSNSDSIAMVEAYARKLGAHAGSLGSMKLAQGGSDGALLAELRALNKAVANAPAVDPISVPISIVKQDAYGAAEALQLIRANRAAQYRKPFG